MRKLAASFAMVVRLSYLMDTVTSLDRYRAQREHRRRTARRGTRLRFYFDLASPYTYLAAERAERVFAALDWVPVSSDALQCATLVTEEERDRIARRARLLGLPLVWPCGEPMRVTGAMRVAALATERGVGAAFVLAATRLVFCGGFNIDDPEILAEAAAAAGIDLGEMLEAAGDPRRDGPIDAGGRRLLAAGVDRLPVLQVGATLFCGEDRLPDAVAAARASA